MAFPDFPCIIDDFNRSNGAAGAHWTTGIDGGATALVINGNQLRNNSTGTFGSIYFNPHTYPADVQFHVQTGAAFGTGGSLATVYARVQGAGTANYDGYAVEGSATATNWTIKLYRVDNGVLTQLGSTANGVGTWASGDAIGIECTGTTIRAYSREGTGGSWTQEVSVTDATYNSAGHTGLSLNVSAATHDIEDFSGGPITPTSSGALSSGTQASDNEFGTVAWTNPGNVASSNDSRATVSLGASGSSQYLAVTNFGASVPGDDIIVGIKLDVERMASAGSTMVDSSIKLYNGGTAIGNDKNDGSIFWPTSDTVKSYFYHPVAWGGSVDVAMVNGSGFGAAISAFNISGTVTASVDHVTITIYSFSPVTNITGTAEITLPSATVASTGAETITGTSAVTIPAATVAATGAALEPVTGTSAIVLSTPTVASTGAVTDVTGASAVVLGGAAVASVGAVTISGSAAVTLPSVAVATSGVETISGSSAVVLNPVTTAASGVETITGSSAVMLNAPVTAATGSVANPVTGAGVVVMQSVVVAAVGEAEIIEQVLYSPELVPGFSVAARRPPPGAVMQWD